MNIFRLLRFLMPLQNPVGFGLTDFVLFGVALLMVAVILARGKIEAGLRRIADGPWWSMGMLAALPIVLRLLLLPHHPIPVPSVSDDFSYLLLGDTLAHLRLANPVHPMHRFFETIFVVQEPSYSSIYPLAQGSVLALGELLFRCPWAGVALSIGAMCALCYWMLRGWVTPLWALIGGLFAVMEFGPLNQWMNNYWGGAVSAIAGCLVFGSLPRLRATGRRRDAALLGIGVGLQILARPFESVLLAICIVPMLRIDMRRLAPVALLACSPALILTLAQNKAVTGSWTTLPYMLSRAQYGIPATFTFQKMPAAQRALTQEQQLDHDAQKDVHDGAGLFIPRWFRRVRFFRFFLLPPLYVALLFFLPELRRARYTWVAFSILVFSVGTNFYPYFYPHYIAAVTCLFLLISTVGLQRMGGSAARLILLLCVAHFVFWYGVHLFGNESLFEATGPYESWDYVNFGDSEGRIAIDRTLAQSPGRQLVFVRYSSRHLLREWIRNAADIDGSKVVWALDLGADEDMKLIEYYRAQGGRKVWLVEPDAVPPRLSFDKQIPQ